MGTILGFLRGLGYVMTQPQALLLGVAVGLALLIYQFPITFVPGFLGLRELARRMKPEAWMLGLAALGVLLFLLAATDPRAGGEYWWNLHYYLQMYVVFALWTAVGSDILWPRLVQRRWMLAGAVLLTIALPIALYALAPALARPFVSNLPGFRPLPGRDNLTYVLSPWKHRETGAREFGERILSALPPESVLFADYSIWAVIRYLQVVEGARPDVELVQLSGDQVSLILRYRDHSNLFLADVYRYYDLEGIRRYFEIQPCGPVYRLVEKSP